MLACERDLNACVIDLNIEYQQWAGKTNGAGSQNARSRCCSRVGELGLPVGAAGKTSRASPCQGAQSTSFSLFLIKHALLVPDTAPRQGWGQFIITGLKHMAGSLHSPFLALPCLGGGGGLLHPEPFSAALQLPPAVETQPRALPNSEFFPCREHRPESPLAKATGLGGCSCTSNSEIHSLSVSESGCFSCSGVKHGINSWNSHKSKLITAALVRSKSCNKTVTEQKSAPSLHQLCLALIPLLSLAVKALVTLPSPGKQPGGSQSPLGRLYPRALPCAVKGR